MTTASVIFDGRPARVDMFFTAGATFNGALSFIDADGDPLDLSAVTLETAVIRSTAGTLATPTLDQSDKANGNLTLSFTTADTLNVLGVHNARWYIRDTTGNVYLDGFVTSAPIGESGVPRWSTGETVTVMAQAYTGGVGGETDHGELTGLGDDDHTQYLNTTRGEYASSVLGAVANAGAPSAGFDNFAAHDDGTIHNETTIGHGTLDPLTWKDGLTESPSLSYALEEAQIASGVLYHRGTKLVAAASIDMPTTAARRTVSTSWAEPTAGPGGGYTHDFGGGPVTLAAESGYASLRLNFIDVDATAGDGYVCYVEQVDENSNHTIRIVRDDATIPTTLVGPVDLGRRLEDGEVLTFGYFDNTYFALAGGTEVCRVTEATYDPATFDSTGIVLNTASLWLPGCYWWSLSDGVPATVDINTLDTTADALAVTVAAKADTADLGGRPVLAAARWDDAEFTPLFKYHQTTVGTESIAVGTMFGCFVESYPTTLTYLTAAITATSAAASELLHIGAYEVDTDGGPGDQLWSQTIAADTVTNPTATGLSLDIPARYYLVILNPSDNSGAVTLRSAHPVEQIATYWDATGLGRAGRFDNSAGGTSLPASLSAYTFADTSATGTRLRLLPVPDMPIIGGRA